MKLYIFAIIILYFYYACEAYPTSQCAIGCRYGTRAMMNATINNGTAFFYSNITACEGYYSGYIGGPEAGSLCADQWHVCNTNDEALIQSVAWADQYLDPISTGKCYAFNAAQDFGLCRYCTGNIHEDDMAAFGAGCQLRNEYSCYAPTALDYKLGYCCQGYLTSKGCEGIAYFDAGILNGAVCCANNPLDPCFYGLCPKNCCNSGVCDFSYGNCTCNTGFVGNDCCTQCSALACDLCLNTTGCAWCENSKSCTSVTDPACHDPLSGTIYEEICPTITNTTTKVNVTLTNVNVPAVVGGAVGAFLALLGIGGFFLYRRFNTGEYEGFWKNYNKLSDGLTDNPLYQKQNIEVVSPLYENK